MKNPFSGIYWSIRSWFMTADVNQWMMLLEARINVLKREKSRSDKDLAQARASVLKAEERLLEEIKRSSQAVARAEGLNKRLEEQVNALSESLKTANDIVIPGLVACNRLFIARQDAEAQVLAIRQVTRKEVE